MSLNHSLEQSQFNNPLELGGRLEAVHYDTIMANEFFVDSIDVTGDINLSNTSNIIQNGNTITPAKFAQISKINQDLSIGSSPVFAQVNGDLNGLVTVGQQKNITDLPNLAIIQGQSVSSTVWPHVATINQDLSTTSNIQTNKLIVQGTATDQLLVKNIGGTNLVVVDTNTPLVTLNCDLTVNGNATYNTITRLETKDPLIEVAVGNLTNTLDLGLYGEYSTDGITPIYTGLFKDHTDGIFKFFDNLATNPGNTISGGYTYNTVSLNKTLTNDGTVSLPSYSWINDSASGLYRIGSNNYGFSIAGSKILDMAATGLSSLNVLPLTDNTYNLGSASIKYANVYATSLTGTMVTGAQPNISSLAGLTSIQGQSLSSSVWPFVSTMNQNVSSTSTPSFSTVTASFIGSLTGNVTGNVSGSAATVTNATQSAITTLPNLASIQGQSVSSSAWQYVNTMNQNVSSGSSPSFINVMAALTGNVTGNLTGNVTGSLIGNVTGNCSGSSATVTNATQSSITSLPSLVNIQGQLVSSTAWQYVNGMNQAVTSGSSPAFTNLTIGTNLNTNSIVSNGTSNIVITPSSGNNLASILTNGVFAVTGTGSSTASLVFGGVNAMYINNSGKTSFGTISNPNSRQVYISGDIEATGTIYGTLSGSATTAATVTNATQSAITTLPNLASIQGQSISSSSWQYVNGMNQAVSSGASPTFNTVTANLTGTLQTASQPNITLVGTLTSLTVSGLNQFQSGAATGYILQSADNSGTCIWSAPSSIAVTSILGTTNQIIASNNMGGVTLSLPQNIATTSNVTFNQLTLNSQMRCQSIIPASSGTYPLGSSSNYFGNCYLTNIYGTLQTAAQTNITSVGTLTSLTVSGNILPSVTNVDNLGSSSYYFATGYFTNLYGTLQTASQPNVTSLGTLSSLTMGGNIVPSVNNTDSIGSSSYYFASGYFTNLYGTLATASQPNVTSLGTLTSLTVSGNILPSVTNTDNLGSASYYFANLYSTNLYGTLQTASQPNITSVGTLTSLTVSGNILPSVNNTDNLGSASYYFANLYSTNLYGTLNTAAQTNITSVGTLTSTLNINLGSGGHSILALSGSSTSNCDIQIGGSSAQCTLGYVGISGQYFTDSAYGDFCIRSESTSNAIRLGCGTGQSTLEIAQTQLIVNQGITQTSGGCNLSGQLTLPFNNSLRWYSGSGGVVYGEMHGDNVSKTLQVTCNGAGVYLANGGTSWSSNSDSSIKSNINYSDSVLSSSLATINSLKTCSYIFNDDEEKTTRYGFIAQDVQTSLPSVVSSSTNSSGATLLGISMTDMIPFMISAIQQLKTLLDAANTRITALEAVH